MIKGDPSSVVVLSPLIKKEEKKTKRTTIILKNILLNFIVLHTHINIYENEIFSTLPSGDKKKQQEEILSFSIFFTQNPSFLSYQKMMQESR